MYRWFDFQTENETDSALWIQKKAQAFLMRDLELDQLRYLSDCSTVAQI